MIFLSIAGSLLEATGMIFQKKILKLKGMNYKNYTVFEFLAIVLTMIPVLFFTWRLGEEAFQIKNLLLLLFVITTSIAANLLTFYSLKRKDVTEFEPLWLMQPLFTVVLAFIFYSSERNVVLLIPALVASMALVVTHLKKNHIYLDKYLWAALGGSFLFAVELVASKPLLPYYSGFTFYFIRCVGILIFTSLLYRPSIKVINKNSIWMIILVGITWFLFRAILYSAYETTGIIFTTTLFILSPVFMIIFAIIFLKEKLTKKQAISTLVILACVIASLVLK
jgi:drug/metabolite transporter (DMT)-like permease